MDHPGAVRLTKTLADLNGIFDDRVERQWLFVGKVMERLPFDVFHSKEGTTIVLADLVNGDDVGMIEFGRRLGFPFESSAAFGILTEMRRKELECDFPIEFGVLREIDLTHATGTDALDDAIMPDYAAVCELNMRSGYVV